MQKLTPEQAGWSLTRIWMTAFEQAAADFHGVLAKTYCKKAYEYATEEWLRVLHEDYGIEAEKAKTIKDGVMSYIKAGVYGGLFADPAQIKLKEFSPNSLGVTVHHCPYGKSCQDLLDHGFSLKTLTCPRLGCFRAAVRFLADIDCDYEVVSVKPDEKCKGIIERK